MLRLVVVARNAAEEEEMVGRARLVADDLGADGVETVVVADGAGETAEARLDAGLYRRPFPDQVLVVGRDRSACSPTDMVFLSTVLHLRRDLSAVTTDGDGGNGVASILEFGAIFRGSPLCQAEGFAGDGRTSVHERLGAVGEASAVLPAPSPRGHGVGHGYPGLRLVPT